MFAERLGTSARAIQTHFDQVLAVLDDLPVVHAMAHATGGGKRLRGFLVLESARLHGVGPDRAIWPATAIEALHAYSLVHDDLPCMDDDDLRRGQPTVHKKWDDATAVLAGDALQALAFDLVSRPETGPPEVRVTLTATLAKAAGVQGMVLGQALDMAAETASAPLTLDQITALQQGKTGALIEWSATAGPRLARADTAALQRYSQALGLAFQIADDVLDVTGNSDTIGKAVGKDAEAGKATFVSLLGLDAARKRADELVEQACDSLAGYGNDADTLKEAARFVVTRAH
ncbi:polyprenyl synthetase family protein [Roseobacter sp.]|uniref:polyprenyl synthetase family protein n=1 Tax=Roseobacter sp. TaxID=1907202 RepID=UPI003859A443